MAELIPQNQASGTIADDPLTDSATEINLDASQGDAFSEPAPGDRVRAKIIPPAPDSEPHELVAITERVGDVLTEVERGIEGTTPLEWEQGSRIAEILTKESLEVLIGRAAIMDVPTPGGGIAYTYAHTVAPNGSFPDGGSAMNDETVHLLNAVTSPESWPMFDTLFGLHGIRNPASGYSPPSYTTGSFGTMWQNNDPTTVLDLGSAIRPSHIALWMQRANASGVQPPQGVKLRSASDSGITTNVATVVYVPSGIVLAPDGSGAILVIRVPESATARRYWEVTCIRVAEWTPVSEIAVYA